MIILPLNELKDQFYPTKFFKIKNVITKNTSEFNKTNKSQNPRCSFL